MNRFRVYIMICYHQLRSCKCKTATSERDRPTLVRCFFFLPRSPPLAAAPSPCSTSRRSCFRSLQKRAGGGASERVCPARHAPHGRTGDDGKARTPPFGLLTHKRGKCKKEQPRPRPPNKCIFLSINLGISLALTLNWKSS